MKRIFTLLIAASGAAGAAWWASGTELLGARPVWSPEPAVYGAPAQVPDSACGPGIDDPVGRALRLPPVAPISNPERVTQGPESPQAAPERKPEAPAPKEPDAGATIADPRFPDAAAPVGLDGFIASACVDYQIQPGDTLSKIARRHRVPAQLLANMNGLDSERILAGARIKTVNGPFHALVIRGRCTLRLFCGGVFVKEYQVATGKPGHETKLGDFKVISRLINPDWTSPETGKTIPFGEPENPLGTRWIGFSDGLGVHGTWDSDSIGKAASSGCVRMRNEDVEELYDFLVIAESGVKIVEDLPEGEKTEGKDKPAEGQAAEGK